MKRFLKSSYLLTSLFLALVLTSTTNNIIASPDLEVDSCTSFTKKNKKEIRYKNNKHYQYYCYKNSAIIISQWDKLDYSDTIEAFVKEGIITAEMFFKEYEIDKNIDPIGAEGYIKKKYIIRLSEVVMKNIDINKNEIEFELGVYYHQFGRRNFIIQLKINSQEPYINFKKFMSSAHVSCIKILHEEL